MYMTIENSYFKLENNLLFLLNVLSVSIKDFFHKRKKINILNTIVYIFEI